jgi:hypothetical protein
MGSKPEGRSKNHESVTNLSGLQVREGWRAAINAIPDQERPRTAARTGVEGFE